MAGTEVDPWYKPHGMTLAEERAALEAAREAVHQRQGMGRSTVRMTQDAVVLGLGRPEAEREAATEYTRSQEIFADDWDEEYGPLWLGHALHAAFLAGARWQREQAAESG